MSDEKEGSPGALRKKRSPFLKVALVLLFCLLVGAVVFWQGRKALKEALGQGMETVIAQIAS